MTRNRWQKDPEAVREAERVFKFIGQYVVRFQWIEGKINEVFLLIRGHDKREKTFAWLSQQTNEKKIDALLGIIVDEDYFAPISVDDWETHVQNVAIRLHAERRRRNGILHAQFLFDFLAIDAPIIRTDIRRTSKGVVFESENLTPARCEQTNEEVARLSFDLNLICVQLRNAYQVKPSTADP